MAYLKNKSTIAEKSALLGYKSSLNVDNIKTVIFYDTDVDKIYDKV